jgi:hypothetical protein
VLVAGGLNILVRPGKVLSSAELYAPASVAAPAMPAWALLPLGAALWAVGRLRFRRRQLSVDGRGG